MTMIHEGIDTRATHDDDFEQHLDMQRTRTFRGNKGPGSFVHWYAKRAGQKDPDSSAKFHGIMAYHGYKPVRSRDHNSIEYEGETEHQKHHFKATVGKSGEIAGIQHHETFKGVNEETKMKKLRDIIPTKETPDIETPPSPESAKEKAFISLHKILKWPQRGGAEDGSPFTVAKVASGKDGKMLAPDVGFKHAPEQIKKLRGVDEEVEELDELDRKTLKSYLRKAGTSSNRAWDKGDKEEDKAMSTDGYKYPEKQARHQANANAAHKTWNKRQKGIAMADRKLRAEEVELGEKAPDGTKYFTTKKD